jgi:hypothetical protein
MRAVLGQLRIIAPGSTLAAGMLGEIDVVWPGFERVLRAQTGACWNSGSPMTASASSRMWCGPGMG